MQVGANMLEEKSPQKCSFRNCKISEIKQHLCSCNKPNVFLQAPRIDQGKHRTTESTLYIADVEKVTILEVHTLKMSLGKGKWTNVSKGGLFPPQLL